MTAAYATTIPDAVKLITGDAEFDVTWRRAETGFRKPVHVELTRVSARRIGMDEVRLKVKDGEPETLVETISGNRALVIQFFCESDEQPQGAQDLADDLYVGLQRQDVRELLATSNLGAGSFGPMMDASYQNDAGDWLAAVMFEVSFPTTTTRQGSEIVRVKTVVASGTVDPDAHPIGPVTVTHDET